MATNIFTDGPRSTQGQLRGGASREERYRAYEARKARMAQAMRVSGVAPPRLDKSTTNLFRDRKEGPRTRLDARDLTHVLDVDPVAGTVDVEGMTTYEAIVDATLPHGVMPAVVPELKSITIGGALAGVGLESSSFRYGLVHETNEEFDVLLATGDVVTCRADNEHRELFFGFPNTYGTLGYALRIRARVIPTAPFVHLSHESFDCAEASRTTCRTLEIDRRRLCGWRVLRAPRDGSHRRSLRLRGAVSKRLHVYENLLALRSNKC